MNHYDNDNDRKVRTTETRVKDGAAGAGIGIGAIIVIAILAVAAFFMFNGKDDTASSAARDTGAAVGSVVEGTKDVAAEVPQAAKDAVTEGDQKTTRPNSDDSTNKLDQK